MSDATGRAVFHPVERRTFGTHTPSAGGGAAYPLTRHPRPVCVSCPAAAPPRR